MLRQHSPTMTISTASSEISLPHKNHHRYKTSATARSTGTSMTTIYLVRLPQFIVFLENKSHHHHANFVTFLVVAWCVGKLTFFLLVRCVKVNFLILSIYTVASRIVLTSSPSGSSMVSCMSRTWEGDEIGIISNYWVSCLPHRFNLSLFSLLMFLITFCIYLSFKLWGFAKAVSPVVSLSNIHQSLTWFKQS